MKPIHTLLWMLFKWLFQIKRYHWHKAGLCFIIDLAYHEGDLSSSETNTLRTFLYQHKPYSFRLLLARLLNNRAIFNHRDFILSTYYWIPGFKSPRLVWLLRQVVQQWIDFKYGRLFAHRNYKLTRYDIKSEDILHLLMVHHGIEIFIQRCNENIYDVILGSGLWTKKEKRKIFDEYLKIISDINPPKAYFMKAFPWKDSEVIFWTNIDKEWRCIHENN